jgi:hypothetical protein
MVEQKRVDAANLSIFTMGNDEDDATGILPDAAKLLWKAKIRAGMAALEAPKKRSPFRKGFYWVFNVWGFAAQTLSPASPPVSYGTTWAAFASFIQMVEDRLKAMEELEEEIDAEAVQ